MTPTFVRRAARSVSARACLIALVAAPGAQAAPNDQLVAALARGDGPVAAQAIVAGGFAGDPAVLGDAVFRAGIVAVDAGHGHPFAVAIAWGFPHGEVPVDVANAAFFAAASAAAEDGLTLAQVQTGGEAVALTNQAYLGLGPRTWTGPTSAGAPTPAPAAAPAPILTRLRVRVRRHHAGSSRNPVVSYHDSRAATTTLTVRSLTGIRRGSRCVKAPARPRRRARVCARDVVVGSFTHADRAGVNTVRLPNALRRKLVRGRYRLVAIAVDAAGSSSPVSARFTYRPSR